MDFDILPEPAFLRIFDYLPLEDRFRIGRVSHSFRRISQIVNGRIKSLDLDDSMFKDLDEEQFEVVLNGCHHKLREIKLRRYFGLLASKFSDFTCPQLVNLDLNRNWITDDEFAQIVTNHPNLQSLKWQSFEEFEDGEEDEDEEPYYGVVFPPVTLPNLETLHILMLNDDMLESLIDRCPILKNLEMNLDGVSSDDILDRFFQSTPHLESLQLDMFQRWILMEELEWFWQLPLKSLTIAYEDLVEDDIEFMINDDFVYKLIDRFKNIEYLDLTLTNVSADAVAALAGLEHLRVAELCIPDDEFADGSIRELSACRSLEELYVYNICLSDVTFLDLFRNCPHLRILHICGVCDGNNGVAIDAETAGMLVLELINTPHRPSITIEISGDDLSHQDGLELRSVWESIQVQNAVQCLKENHGMEVDIRLVDMPPPVDEMMEQDGDLESENNQADGDQMDGGQVVEDEMNGDQGGGNQADA